MPITTMVTRLAVTRKVRTEPGRLGSSSAATAAQSRLNKASMLGRVIQMPSRGCDGLESDKSRRSASKGTAAVQAMETVKGMS